VINKNAAIINITIAAAAITGHTNVKIAFKIVYTLAPGTIFGGAIGVKSARATNGNTDNAADVNASIFLFIVFLGV
jgi:hypothetical protein